MFKKAFNMIGIGAMAIALTACGGEEKPENQTDTEVEEPGSSEEDVSSEEPGSSEEDVAVDSEVEEADPMAHLEDLPDVVATVNGEDIGSDVYQGMYEQTMMMFQMQGMKSDGSEEMHSIIHEQVINNLVAQELIKQEAEKQGYEIDDTSVEEQIQQIKDQFETTEEFEEALAAENLGEEQLRVEIVTQLKIENYIEEQSADVEVTEEELEQQYQLLKEQSGDELPAYDEYKSQLEQQLTQQKSSETIQLLIEELKQASDVQLHV